MVWCVRLKERGDTGVGKCVLEVSRISLDQRFALLSQILRTISEARKQRSIIIGFSVGGQYMIICFIAKPTQSLLATEDQLVCATMPTLTKK